MSSTSRRKGYTWEHDLITHLRDNGFPHADRPRAGATDDVGDIIGTPGIVWEAKNQKTLTLAAWVDELQAEITNSARRYQQADPPVGAVIHKRRGTTNVGDAYATMPVHMYLRLLKEAGYAAS